MVVGTIKPPSVRQNRQSHTAPAYSLLNRPGDSGDHRLRDIEIVALDATGHQLGALEKFCRFSALFAVGFCQNEAIGFRGAKDREHRPFSQGQNRPATLIGPPDCQKDWILGQD